MDDQFCWTTARQELLAWLKRNAPSLAELYEGAVELLYRHPLPGRTRFVGHAVREIRNRLPDAISGSTRGSRLDYTKRLKTISAAWINAGLHEHNIPSGEEFHSPPSAEDPRIPVEIPSEIHRLIDDLVADHLKIPETRAEAAGRFFEACAPENKTFREILRPVVRNWMTVTDWFMDLTHDSGETDAVCDEQELRRKFELFESILGSLIRAFFASLDELDEILAASDVTQADRAISLLARAEHNRYFFDKLDDPRWIGPLAEKGFFRHPPPLITVQGGQYVQIPRWPESQLLARIARSASEHEQEQIVAIACVIPETENTSVHLDLAEIALSVPPELAVRFVPKAKKWVGDFTLLHIPTKLGELAVHLAQGGYFKEARDLVRHLLAILPDPRKGKADQAPEHYTPNPRARIKSWSYGEILGKHVRELVRRDGLPTFDVLCDLLSAAVRQSLYDGDTKQGDDYSASWRRAIEDHDQNTLKRDLRCMLAEAVRDAAIQIVVKDQGAIRRIVERLERRKLPIFDRIALHLLWTHADSAPDLVTERLTRKDLYDSSKHRHEYTLLLQDRFAHLVPADRERILSWIEEGPDVERFAASHESWTGRRPSAEETERYADHDRLERLWPIRDDLPEPWQHRVASLADRFGQPEHPDFLHYNRFESTTLEDRSPKTVDDLRRMPIEHIASFVQNWQPTDEFRGPSHEGLQYVLMKLVADEPERFAAACHLFQGSSPTYIHAMLQGLREAVTTGKSFPWSPVLELCTQLVSEKGIAQGAAADGGPPGEEPSAANSAIAGLLREALSHDAIPIPINLQDAVWEVLEHLAGTHDPTPADDSPDANRLKTVPFAVTTRVAILDAVISYGIWVVRRLTADHLGTTPPSGLDAIPEVKQVLNDYLDPLRHPTVEVRAFFGRILPRLTAFDTPWVEDNLSRIFPADAGSIHLHDAAWRGFILWNHPNRLVFGMLRDLYGKAVDRIQLTSEQERHYDPDWQLARHLMIVYWYGEIEAEGEDGLLTRFFAKAPDALRAEAIQFLGMSLGEGNSVPDEVLDRLKRLWKIRLEAAGGRADHVQELTAFGAWLVSEKFDEVWAMAQLKEILQRVGKAEPEDEVVKWLAKVAPRFAIEAVECLGRMSEGFDWDYHVSHWTKHANVVLGTALRDPKPETRRAATDLINHLGSRGHHQFRTLLRDSSGPQN